MDTLIELLVTLAIIGTLAGIGIFIYNGYTATAKKMVMFKRNLEKEKIDANWGSL